MKKQMYAKLNKLTDLWKDDAAWQANAADCDADGLTLAGEDEDGQTEVQEFADADMQLADGVYVYDFAGSANESERFYSRDEQVFKHTDGSYWLLWRENIEAF